MKNSMKKLLSVVLATVMLLAMSIPALAAEDNDVEIKVTVSDSMGYHKTATVSIDPDRATLKRVIQSAEEDLGVDFYIYSKTGTLRGVTIKDGDKEIENGSLEPFRSDRWYIAVNGKVIEDMLETYILDDEDIVTVFWGDDTIGTKLVQMDDSEIAKGVITFFYYGEDGERVPLKNATVKLVDKDGKIIANKLMTEVETNAAGTDIGDSYLDYHITSEKGEIWVSPEHLEAANTIKVISLEVEPAKYGLKASSSEYDDEEAAFFVAYGKYNISTADVLNAEIEIEDDMYNIPSTGDDTVIYIIIMAAAVMTLGVALVVKSGRKSGGEA